MTDLRYAVRSLVRHKAFTLTAVATLALGIGATTAVFSVVDGVILRPLPFADPNRLVHLYWTPANRGEAISFQAVNAFREQSASFESFAGYEVSARYLRTPAGPERVMAVSAERSFFSLLGVPPILGRTFRPDDPAAVTVISEVFWRARLGGLPSVVGSSLAIDGEPLTVVGIMPASFQFPYGAASLLPGVASETRTDLWIPFPGPGRANVIGRLKANVSLDAAESELVVIAAREAASNPTPQNQGRSVRLVQLSNAVVGPAIRRPLFLLFGAVGLVLALSCANVASLSLVRVMLRRREIAVRTALGASPRRLGGQLLTESALLTLAGGALGWAIAWWGTKGLMVFVRAHIPRASEVGLDWRVFLFLLLACALTGVIFGFAPAAIAARMDPQPLLQETSGTSASSIGQQRLRNVLVVGEIALAFVLAVAAVLLIRELMRLRRTDSGMRTANVLTVHVGQRGLSPARAQQFSEIADRVAALPGVGAAAFAQLLPLQNWGWSANSGDFRIRGVPPQPSTFSLDLRYVTPGYFEALSIPIRRGRAFRHTDTRDAPPVIIVNEVLARRYFGGDDPIGRETSRGTIVGVAADVRQASLDRPASPEILYPITQNWSQVSELGMTLIVRGTGVGSLRSDSRAPSLDAILGAIREVNPALAVFSAKTMDSVIDDSLSSFTLFLWLMSSFAALAVALALTGTYGVVASMTAARTREFGIRLALGAGRSRVMSLVLARGARLTAAGLALGLGAALAAVPLLQDLPIGVRPPDAATTVPVALFISVVSLAACLIPARRAASADPIAVLRSE